VVDPNLEALALDKFLLELERRKLATTSPRRSATIVICQRTDHISARALHYISVEAMRSQTNTHANVLICEKVPLPEVLQALSRSGDLFPKPLLIYDETYSPSLNGLSPLEMEILEGQKKAPERPGEGKTHFSSFDGLSSLEMEVLEAQKKAAQRREETIRDVLRKVSHLFVYDQQYELIRPLYSTAQLLASIKAFMADELNRLIMNPTPKLFDPKVQVLTPSRKYCEGYFEVFKVLASEGTRRLAMAWLKMILLELRPDFVISVTAHMGSIVNEVIDDLKSAQAITNIN
jgi:hypothetical protein